MSKLIRSSYQSKTFDSDKFKLMKEWDIDSASHIYRLYNRYETYTDGFNGPSYSWHKVGQGDEQWAVKTSKHYDIEIKEQS